MFPCYQLHQRIWSTPWKLHNVINVFKILLQQCEFWKIVHIYGRVNREVDWIGTVDHLLSKAIWALILVTVCSYLWFTTLIVQNNYSVLSIRTSPHAQGFLNYYCYLVFFFCLFIYKEMKRRERKGLKVKRQWVMSCFRVKPTNHTLEHARPTFFLSDQVCRNFQKDSSTTQAHTPGIGSSISSILLNLRAMSWRVMSWRCHLIAISPKM